MQQIKAPVRKIKKQKRVRFDETVDEYSPAAPEKPIKIQATTIVNPIKPKPQIKIDQPRFYKTTLSQVTNQSTRKAEKNHSR